MTQQSASNRKDVRAAEKASAIANAQRLDFIRLMMSSVQGRAFAHSLLADRCHVFSSTFAHNPLQMSFAEGERNVGLQLLTDVMVACPDQYIIMMREANDRYNSDNRSADSRRDRDSAAERSLSPDPGRDAEGSVDTDYNPYGATEDA